MAAKRSHSPGKVHFCCWKGVRVPPAAAQTLLPGLRISPRAVWRDPAGIAAG